MDKLLRPCIAELVGTFFLCFIGAGAICTNAMLGSYDQSGSGLLGVALAHGLALGIGMTATMAISGGHLNPAVTITMWVYKKIDTDRAIAYLLAQLLGGIIAGGLIVIFFNQQTAVAEASFGTPTINRSILHVPENEGINLQQLAWATAIEAVLTFLLVFTFFGTAIDPRAPKVGGFAIGLIIACDILMGGPLTGAAMNPARAFGPGIWQAAISPGGWDRFRQEQLVYWIGPIVGGVLAGGLYLNSFLPQEENAPAHSHAAPGKV